jgi:hypothetical protein
MSHLLVINVSYKQLFYAPTSLANKVSAAPQPLNNTLAATEMAASGNVQEDSFMHYSRPQPRPSECRFHGKQPVP